MPGKKAPADFTPLPARPFGPVGEIVLTVTMLHCNILIPIILCPGSGTRLWPLSRKRFPNQFVPLVNGKSLLQPATHP